MYEVQKNEQGTIKRGKRINGYKLRLPSLMEGKL